MDIEYEAKFADINKNEIRGRLEKGGATLTKPETLQRRTVFYFPTGHELNGAWLRVRDEGDKITMSIKVAGTAIEDQKEIMLTVDSYDHAASFLRYLGCKERGQAETKREWWELDGVEVTIDEWPFLEPFVEIEGQSEAVVRQVSERLGFDWSRAVFGSTHLLTMKKYGIPETALNNEIPHITFDGPNPYQAWLDTHQSDKRQ